MSIEARVIDPSDDPAQVKAAASFMSRVFFGGEDPRGVEEKLFSPATRCLGLYDEASLVSFGMYVRVAHHAVLMTIAVDPGRLRQGLGTTLLTAIESDAARDGAVDMNLTPENEGARAFFTANGYEPSDALMGTANEGRLLVRSIVDRVAEGTV